MPPKNVGAAVSPPNALIGSRYTPPRPNPAGAAARAARSAPAPSITVSDSSPVKTFDLFGLYIQPMVAPGIRGVDVYFEATAIDGTEYSFGATFLPIMMEEPWYFEPHAITGEKWDRLTEVRVWAELPGVANIDWEFFVDDVWVRWGFPSPMLCAAVLTVIFCRWGNETKSQELR